MSAILENAKRGLPRFEDSQKESEQGAIYSISGPVVTAQKLEGASMFEIVRIGHDHCLGEIIQMKGETATIQVFDDISALRPGDPVMRTHHPLTIELGPGLMNSIYDGIQRPLDRIAESSQSIFIPRGVDVPPLDHHKMWLFEPQMKVGMHITAGDVYGKVEENEVVTHFILLPPGEMGVITFIAPQGNYALNETVLEVEFQGKTKKFSMVQTWPVRKPRPVAEKLFCDTPLLTGTRILDALFPAVQGGTCALPGAWGGGKFTIIQTIAKYTNSDNVVYVGCQRTAEMVEALMSFPYLTIPDTEKRVSVMERTSVITNPPNLPPAIRDASIHTGITVAEYYRDMGKNVSMTVDSMSRWADALKEIGSYVDGLPAEDGYPAYLGSRLAMFYERAGKVSCLGSPSRTGSVAIVATISPTGGSWDDLVVNQTMKLVQGFWAIDIKLAQRKHFPSISWDHSFSKYRKALEPFYSSIDPEFVTVRHKMEEILQKEVELNETAQLVGKDELPLPDRVLLATAKIIREDFLQQNIFTPYDRYCPMYKTCWMAKNIITFYTLAEKLIAHHKLTWQKFSELLGDMMYRLCCMKFMDPAVGQDKIDKDMKSLHDEVRELFQNLEDSL